MAPVARTICQDEEIAFDRILRESALQRRARDLDQLTLIHAEALARHGVLAADTTAEVRRIVRVQRDPNPNFTKRPERVVLIGGEDAGGGVAGGALLEHDAALGYLGHQRGILDGSDAVRDARE